VLQPGTGWRPVQPGRPDRPVPAPGRRRSSTPASRRQVTAPAGRHRHGAAAGQHAAAASHVGTASDATGQTHGNPPRRSTADLDPAAFTYHPAALAGLLTTFGDDLAPSECPCAG